MRKPDPERQSSRPCIPSDAQLIDQIGSPCGGEDYLYRDPRGNFYLRREIQKREQPEGAQYTFPRDSERYKRDAGHESKTVPLSHRAALEWFVQEAMNETPLKKLMLECVAAFVPMEERDGKSRVEAWVAPRVASGLASVAKKAGRTTPAQLELFVMQAVAASKPHRKAAKSERRMEGPGAQLELATALVVCCAKLTNKPNSETLEDARRNVSELHRDLHSDETFKAVANG